MVDPVQSTRRTTTEPLMLRHAVPRLDYPGLDGGYDAERSVWMLPTPDGPVPAVEHARTDLLEMVTKTKVLQEIDDESSRLMEGFTSAASRREHDGRARLAGVVELETKTFVQTEADDDARQGLLLEFETKTAAQIEHDDQSDPLL